MKIEEHKRRAEVYRAAAEHGYLNGGMCVAIAEVLDDTLDDPLGPFIEWDSPETLPFRKELAKEVGRLDRFHVRMNGSFDGTRSGTKSPNPDRVLIRGEIITRAAEYHEACVAAGRTL